MSKVVLDSSALLAFVNGELGADTVEEVLADAVLSTVNLAEVISRLVLGSRPAHMARKIIDTLELAVADFDRGLAQKAGEMAPRTRAFGLSLGDRACLALAAREGLPALTADRAWKGVDVGVEIQLIR